MYLAIYPGGRKLCRTNVPHAPRSPQYIASLIHRRTKNTNRIANQAIASLTQIQSAFIRYAIYALAGGSSVHPDVHLRVDSAVLSLILHCSKHTHADPGWDAAGVDHTALLDLILASKDLGNRGLFDLISPATPSPPGSRPMRSVRIRPGGGSAPQPDPKLEKALLAVQFVRYFTRDGVVGRRINFSSVIKQWIRCITWIGIVVLPRMSALLPQPSIGCLIRVVEEKDGGPACIDIMEHTLRTMRYQAWRRDPEEERILDLST